MEFYCSLQGRYGIIVSAKRKGHEAMKLSKKNVARQRDIQKAIASGKALGGLLVGFAATVAGCGERHTPANTMGRFPDPSYQENAKNEDAKVFVTEGEIPEPGETPAQESSKTNAVNEADDEAVVMGGVGGDS